MNKQEAIKELETIFQILEKIEPLSQNLNNDTYRLVINPLYSTAAKIALENNISEDEMEIIETNINSFSKSE